MGVSPIVVSCLSNTAIFHFHDDGRKNNPKEIGWWVFLYKWKNPSFFHFSSEGILLVPWSTWQLSPQSMRSSSLMPWYHWPPFSPMQPLSFRDSRHPKKPENSKGTKKNAGHLKITIRMKMSDTSWKQIMNRFILVSLITPNVKLLGPLQLAFFLGILNDIQDLHRYTYPYVEKKLQNPGMFLSF